MLIIRKRDRARIDFDLFYIDWVECEEVEFKLTVLCCELRELLYRVFFSLILGLVHDIQLFP
jgi:hypothetical protein